MPWIFCLLDKFAYGYINFTFNEKLTIYINFCLIWCKHIFIRSYWLQAILALYGYKSVMSWCYTSFTFYMLGLVNPTHFDLKIKKQVYLWINKNEGLTKQIEEKWLEFAWTLWIATHDRRKSKIFTSLVIFYLFCEYL